MAIRARVLREEPICPCGRPATQVDHVQPLTRGGTHERGNLQALCASCHNVKTKRQAAAVFSGGSREKPRPNHTHANPRIRTGANHGR